MFSKKAEAGIGTLILFIALILVAAVAAGVLIQTSSSLQSKALATGSKAKTQVSTQVQFNVVWGENGSTGQLDTIYAELKLAAGSDPIKLNDTLVEFILSDQSVNLANNGTFVACNYSSANLLPADRWGTEYLVQGNSYKEDYLQLGDVVLICFQSPRAIDEDESFQILVIPKTGGLTQINGRTPEVITNYKESLWPV